jgi:hypothetical protein
MPWLWPHWPPWVWRFVAVKFDGVAAMPAGFEPMLTSERSPEQGCGANMIRTDHVCCEGTATAGGQHGAHVDETNYPMSGTLQAAGPAAPAVGALGLRAACVLITLAIVGYIDQATGYEVSVFLLYLIPVALATRWLGVPGGVLVATMATGVWILADWRSGHTYSHPWYLYVNAINRFGCFLLAVAIIRHVRARHGDLMRRIEAFSGEVPVCSACHRIGSGDGYWRSFESYIAEFGGAEIKPKVCPDCARRSYARAAYHYQADQAG